MLGRVLRLSIGMVISSVVGSVILFFLLINYPVDLFQRDIGGRSLFFITFFSMTITPAIVHLYFDFKISVRRRIHIFSIVLIFSALCIIALVFLYSRHTIDYGNVRRFFGWSFYCEACLDVLTNRDCAVRLPTPKFEIEDCWTEFELTTIKSIFSFSYYFGVMSIGFLIGLLSLERSLDTALQPMNLELEIIPSRRRYRIHARAPDGSEFAIESDIDASKPRSSIFEGCSRSSSRGLLLISNGKKSSYQNEGEKLFLSVFREDILGCFRASMNDAGKANEALCIRLCLPQELVGLSWEYLYDPSTSRFLAVYPETPLVRTLKSPEPTKPLRITPPLRVLVVMANPPSTQKLAIDQEWNLLNKALASLPKRAISIRRLENATFVKLEEMMSKCKRRGKQLHVIHFIGHGEDGGLYFEDQERGSRLVGGAKLAAVLSVAQPHLIILNSCEGAHSSHNNEFLSVAQILIKQGIPAVVAMQEKIADQDAIHLAKTFYESLAQNRPIESCLTEARKSLWLRDSADWGVPVLYMRATDGHLLPDRKKGARS